MVTIDYKKCLGPKCGKCVGVCPTGVFMDVPVGKFVFRKEPESRRVVSYHEKLCTLCKYCVKVCPENCISLD